jgi:DNA polymerase III subunit gamma/tau
MNTALYNKWRPQKWDEVVGQQHVIQTLRNAVTGGHIVHAYLFAGPRGTGKTTAARLLAKAVNCLDTDPAEQPCNVCAHCLAVNESRFLDLIEIDAASNTSVEDVRDLRDKINFMPNQGKYKVYIIDEVHMLSTAAFNALLKTLEEPPAHAIFILATTEIHKIPATVLSRCQRHEFRRIPVDNIVSQLNHIVESEKLSAEPEALRLIARQSAGGMRDAISLLDQMASTGKEITLSLTQTVLGTATSQIVVALVSAVLDREAATGMDAIHSALDSGSDPRLLARQVVDYLRALLLIQMGNVSQVDLAADAREQAEKHAIAFSPLAVLQMIKSFNAAASDLRGGWQPSLPLELALAETMEMANAVPPAAVRMTEVPAQGTSSPKKESYPPAKKILQTFYQSADPHGRETEKPSSPLVVEPIEGSRVGVTLVQVVKAWRQISAEVKSENPNLNPLLNSAHPLEIKGNVLVLGFTSELLRSKADIPDQLEITRKAIKKVVGADLMVKCVVTNVKHSPPPNVKVDGMVAAALKAGGEIVDIQE